ncbi:hypothetical protein SODG_001561 [Sodalis praecaptivus]
MANPLAQPTFLVHDYETFGKHPALDRPAQFAGIRADSQFETLGEPEVFLLPGRRLSTGAGGGAHYRDHASAGVA